MKNFIAELLIKLTEKEEETKELSIKVRALEIIVTGLLQSLDKEQKLKFTDSMDSTLESFSHSTSVDSDDSYELNKNLARLMLIQND